MSTKKIVNGLPFHNINRALVVPGCDGTERLEISEMPDRTTVKIRLVPAGYEDEAKCIFLDADAFSELRDQLGYHSGTIICLSRESILKEMEEERKYAESERIRRAALAASTPAEPTEK